MPKAAQVVHRRARGNGPRVCCAERSVPAIDRANALPMIPVPRVWPSGRFHIALDASPQQPPDIASEGTWDFPPRTKNVIERISTRAEMIPKRRKCNCLRGTVPLFSDAPAWFPARCTLRNECHHRPRRSKPDRPSWCPLKIRASVFPTSFILYFPHAPSRNKKPVSGQRFWQRRARASNYGRGPVGFVPIGYFWKRYLLVTLSAYGNRPNEVDRSSGHFSEGGSAISVSDTPACMHLLYIQFR